MPSPEAPPVSGSAGTGSAFSIRAAGVGDAPALHELVSELAAYEHLSHELASSPAAFVRDLFGARPFARAMLAFAAGDGAPAGFAVWFPTYSTFAGRAGGFLEDLYVRPWHRRRGIGHALFDAFAADAAAFGCRRLEWRALAWNTPALAFYKTLGAEVLGDWRTLRLEAPVAAAEPAPWRSAAPPAVHAAL